MPKSWRAPMYARRIHGSPGINRLAVYSEYANGIRIDLYESKLRWGPGIVASYINRTAVCNCVVNDIRVIALGRFIKWVL